MDLKIKPTIKLHEAIASALHSVKAGDLPKVCVALGLADGTEGEAFASKRTYVKKRLPDDLAAAMQLASEVCKLFDEPFALEEALWLAEEEGKERLSDETRKALLDAILLMPVPFGGDVGNLDMLRRVFPLAHMPSAIDGRYDTLSAEAEEHFNSSDDWTPRDLLEYVGVPSCSDRRFRRFLEELVHPAVRRGDDQKLYLEAIDEHLKPYALALVETDRVAEQPVYRVRARKLGVSGRPKNLIFASKGPKPELCLLDAINNDIAITKNAEHCLVYDRPIGDTGLRWADLLRWWAEIEGTDPRAQETARSLYQRLLASVPVESPPEKLLFTTFYTTYSKVDPAALPALIPQVYLHFDPLTIRERGSASVLQRQRMDLLLLFSSHERIVVEVDGRQHYSDENGPSPAKYASMMAEDRRLRLTGYEVYRFGGAELQGAKGAAAAAEFFRALFAKHRVALA